MSFTIATDITGKSSGLAAVCDRCGTVQLTTRADTGECLLPEQWVRLYRESFGVLYGLEIMRSTLVCPNCIQRFYDE